MNENSTRDHEKGPAMTIQAAVITEPGVVTTGPAPGSSPEVRAVPPGWVSLRPTAVGICGSDVHYFHGDTGALTGETDWYPRVPGHELSAVVEEMGEGVADDHRLRPGELVAVWPLETCGQCYPCRRGKENACTAMRILGVHRDGGMSGRVLAPASSVFAVHELAPEVAAFIEPMSVAIHSLAQAGLHEDSAVGVRLLVLGGGPIGQAVLLAAATWGATVAVVDPKPDRRATAEQLGALQALAPDAPETAALRRWGPGAGADVVVDTTGAPHTLQLAADLVAPTGTVVAVGLTGGSAPFSPGVLPEKEITVVGSSCATRADFAAAVRLVQFRPEEVASLISHVLPLERVAEAFDLAQRSDAGTMKVVVSVR